MATETKPIDPYLLAWYMHWMAHLDFIRAMSEMSKEGEA